MYTQVFVFTIWFPKALQKARADAQGLENCWVAVEERECQFAKHGVPKCVSLFFRALLFGVYMLGPQML